MDSAQKVRAFHIIEWLARLGLAGVFFAAAIPKLLDPAAFAKDIENYRVVLPFLGKDYINLTALYLPALEFVSAIAILLNSLKRAAAWTMTGLLAVFLIMITQAVLRGYNIDCGCFGSGAASKALAHTTGIVTILQDLLFLTMSGFVLWRGKGQSMESVLPTLRGGIKGGSLKQGA